MPQYEPAYDTIYHLTLANDFDPVATEYLPPQFAEDGFIHCTHGLDLMFTVANKYYRNVPGDFLLLIIDVDALTSPLKYEALDPALPTSFPHIYGALNREAVIGILKLRRNADGTFVVPPFLKI